MTIGTDCGYVNLLGTILKVENGDFWLRWGVMPPGMKPCIGCGRPIERYDGKGNHTGIYCLECRERIHHITLRCGQCGNKFRLDMSVYRIRLKRRRVPLFFCGNKCWGKYAGLNYGIRRKYDPKAVKRLWLRTRWTVTEIARYLNIPRSSVSSILLRFKGYKQYRKARRERHG